MIFYLTMDGLQSTPYMSQVLGAAAPLREAGADLRLVTWTRRTPERAALCDEREAETRARLGDAAVFLDRGPNLSALTRRRLAADLSKLLDRWGLTPRDRVVLHARSPWMGLTALEVRRRRPGARVITDFRGAMTAEAEMVLAQRSWPFKLAGRFWIEACRRAERTCALESDHLLCVSRAFRDLIMDRYGTDPERVTSVPCFVDHERFGFDPAVRESARAEFGARPETRVLLYCGTLRYYSRTAEILRAYRHVKDLAGDALLVFITPDKDLALEAARNADIAKRAVRVVKGRHEEVARWMQAGDVAFLLREEDEVNRVACPMKFAEYVRSGVKVLVTPGLGDLPRFVREKHAGWVHACGAPFPLSLHRAYGEAERRRLCDSAGRVFGRDRHVPRLLELYRRLGGAVASRRCSTMGRSTINPSNPEAVKPIENVERTLA